jgi:ATP-dependent Zn protease
MDGIEENKNIIVIGATNREDLLDQALVRPGRFDYKIHVELPNKLERINIFNLYLKKYVIFVIIVLADKEY